MEYFDQEQLHERENEIYELNKKKYIEKTQRQFRIFRVVFGIVFGVIGILFLSTGIGIARSNDGNQEDLIPFVIIGGMFIFMAILFFIIFTFAKPTAKTFDRINNRAKKYGYCDLVMLSSMVETQEERVRELEARVNELECELERVRKK